MQISIASGVGTGQTKMSAFDAALWDAGIANFNLLKLSSVIPENSQITESKKLDIDPNKDFGKRLYVVLSEKRESEKGREAWAGLGWVQREDGRGLFVEQEGAQKAEVIRLIKETLEDMTKTRNLKFGEIHYRTTGIRCEDKPVCALVAAVYLVEDWVGVRTSKNPSNTADLPLEKLDRYISSELKKGEAV